MSHSSLMEERNQKSENDPKPTGNNPDRFQSKPLIIWLIFIALILMLLVVPQQEPTDHRLKMPELLELARQEKVVTVKIKENPDYGYEGYTVRGEMLKEALKDIGRSSSTDSVVDAATANSEATAATESANGEGVSSYLAYRADGRLTDEDYRDLRSNIKPGNFEEQATGRLWRNVLLNLLPILLIFALIYFLFIRQLRMAGKGAMSFGKSKAKMLTRDKERAVFADVAGCDEAKEEVSEVVDFLRSPKKFQNIGGRIPKGILMIGPPGTGKTLLAKAIAGEADVPFFSISGSDFVEMFVGVGAARVRDMFDQGRRHAPCIIFIDEIDAVGRQRGSGMGGGNDEREQTLNSLLVEMDGFDTQEGIIIIAATNRADVLDQALMRPGRFDRQIMIDLPDLAGREAILKVHAKKIKLGRGIDLNRVARATTGFSGADLANLLNESALLAARYNKKEVSMADIEEARDKIAYGRERRKLMDEEDRQSTAWHEAGHALVQALINDKKMQLHKVTILPRGGSLGMTMSSPTKDILGQSMNEYLNHICMAMAGRIAEKVHTGDISSGAYMDIRQATAMARRMVCDLGMSKLGPVAYGENRDSIFLAREITRRQDFSEETARQIDEEIRRIIQEQYDRAEQMIREHDESVRKIADALLEHETIEGKHVREILEFGEIRSPVVNNLRVQDEDVVSESDEKPKPQEKEITEDGEFGPEPTGAPA